MTLPARLVEVHRLAVAGGETVIARTVERRISRVWLARSRFADVARLAELTLTLGEDADAFYHLGWAKQATGYPTQALAAYDRALKLYRASHDRWNEAATLNNIGAVHNHLGDRRQALDHYRQALTLTRKVGDRAGEATTLNNIGLVHNHLGDQQQALDYFRQALTLRREVGDRAGEAVTRYNIAMIYRRNGALDQAVAELEQVVELDRQVAHPDLASDTTMLEQVRAERATGSAP